MFQLMLQEINKRKEKNVAKQNAHASMDRGCYELKLFGQKKMRREKNKTFMNFFFFDEHIVILMNECFANSLTSSHYDDD